VVNFLPIVSREMRVVSRKPWIYFARSIFALLGIIAVLMMFYEGPSHRTDRGAEMLWVLSVVTMILALLSGSLLTADCISSEKREDTLGFLFLTNLKGYDIVTGKISIHAVTTACGLLAVFPVFFLPILAGGVTWGETLRVVLGIGVSFLFALSLGVWISTRSHDARNTIMATLIIIVLVVALPLLWLTILEEFFRIRPWLVGVPQLSPGMLLFYARDSWYSTPWAKAGYWISVGFFLVTSVILACLASCFLPRAWRADAASLASEGVPSRWPFRLPGWIGWPFRRRFRAPPAPSVWRVVRRRRFRSLSENPFLDLALSRIKEFPWTKRLRQLATSFVLLMLFFSFVGGEEEAFVFAVVTVFAMHAAAKFVYAFDATRLLNEDKRSSALELLLATPLGERQIADGQARAFTLEFKPHVRRLFLLTLTIQFIALVNNELHMRGDDLFFFGAFIWGAMIWTWSDYRTVSWIGMRHALKQNSHIKATLRTLLSMAVLPWGPYFFVLFCMAASNVDEEFAALVTLFWALGGTVFQGIKARIRRVEVIRRFRDIVSGADSASRTRRKARLFWNIFPEKPALVPGQQISGY
jgi:hypothetical protein